MILVGGGGDSMGGEGASCMDEETGRRYGTVATKQHSNTVQFSDQYRCTCLCMYIVPVLHLRHTYISLPVEARS